MWNKVSKEHDHDDYFNSDGCELSCFELIVLIFNAKDGLNNFWVLSNRRTKGCKCEGEGLTLYVNHSS